MSNYRCYPNGYEVTALGTFAETPVVGCPFHPPTTVTEERVAG